MRRLEGAIAGSKSALHERESQRNVEYLYRKLIPMTHAQYLEEPKDTIEWMVRIDGLYRAEENRRAKG